MTSTKKSKKELNEQARPAGRRAVAVPSLLRNKGLGPDWAQGLLHGNEPPKSKSHSLSSPCRQIWINARRVRKVPFQPLLGSVSNAPQLRRPYSQVAHCQSRHGAASPVLLRCCVLSPGSRSDKKETAKSRVCHPSESRIQVFGGLTRIYVMTTIPKPA